MQCAVEGNGMLGITSRFARRDPVGGELQPKTKMAPFGRIFFTCQPSLKPPSGMARMAREKNSLRKRRLFWFLVGGERGIRTLDTLRYTRFPGVPVQPLLHLSG